MKISIVIPYYNGEAFIAKAICSVKEQSYTNFEVLLVNNGSTDRSEEVAKEEVGMDKRFVFLKEPKIGISNALNKGIANSRGEYISFLDCDDVYLGNRLEQMLKHINDGADLVACRGLKIDSSGHVFGETPRFFKSPEMVSTILMHHNIVNSLSYIMVRRDVLMEFIPLPEKYSWILDYYLMISMSKKNKKIDFIDEPFVKRLYHSNNHSLNYSKIMKQVIPLLIDYYKSNESIKTLFTKEFVGKLLTQRYIKGAQYMRRHSDMDAIKEYLKVYVDSGYIKKEYYFYFFATSLFNRNKLEFCNYVNANNINHPLGDFIRGYYYFYLKEFKKAELNFKKSMINSNMEFPEVMNLYALSLYFSDKKSAILTLWEVVQKWPDYKDAFYNIDMMYLDNNNEFKANVFLTSQTLYSLLNLSKALID